VHVGCADGQVELKASGLWVVRLDGPGTEIGLEDHPRRSCVGDVDGGGGGGGGVR